MTQAPNHPTREPHLDPIQLISRVRSGVAQIVFEHDGHRVGSGTAFLVDGGLVTCRHCIPSSPIDAVLFRFDDQDPQDLSAHIRLDPETCQAAIAAQSPEEDKDFVYLQLREPEFHCRYEFELRDATALAPGQQTLFLGYPFGMSHLTAHMAYVSSIHERNGVGVIQLDGSVSGANSGGPLLDLRSGKVAAIVTGAVTGLIQDEFDSLIQALRQNQRIANAAPRGIILGDVDVIQALGASQVSLERIAKNLSRSANVGIGYAYSAEYARDAIARVAA